SAHALQLRRAGEMDRRLRSLLHVDGADEEGEPEAQPEQELVVHPEIAGDEARMERVGRDARALEPSGQLVGEQAVGELRALIGTPTGIAALALQVREIDAGALMGARGDVDDPRRSG